MNTINFLAIIRNKFLISDKEQDNITPISLGKMNFCNLLVIVYILAEFGCIMYVENSKSSIQDVQIAGESRKKRKAVKRANEKGVELLSYRFSIEEPARIKANKRIEKFQRHTKTAFTNVKPQHGIYTRWLWNRAKEAADKYEKSKNGFAKQFNIFIIKAHKSWGGVTI